jgi:putative hydrolase of the HAD superfamily
MTILFDLDDTLVDHTTAFVAATATLYRTIDSPLSLEQFSATWTASLRRHFDRYLAGELSYDEQRRARVREVIDGTLSDDAVDQVISVYLASYEAHWSLFPDVESALDKLSGHRLGVVTNGQVYQQRLKLERTGILERFDCIVISDDLGVAKPDPRIFLRACSLLREEPRYSFMVGDHYELDAIGARRAGLGGIWLDRPGTATTEHEHPIVSSLNDLEHFLVAPKTG